MAFFWCQLTCSVEKCSGFNVLCYWEDALFHGIHGRGLMLSSCGNIQTLTLAQYSRPFLSQSWKRLHNNILPDPEKNPQNVPMTATARTLYFLSIWLIPMSTHISNIAFPTHCAKNHNNAGKEPTLNRILRDKVHYRQDVCCFRSDNLTM